MKKLLRLMLGLGLGTFLGLMVYRDPGYVLLAWDTWTIEMPLWLLLALFATVTFLLLWFNRSVHVCGRAFSQFLSAVKQAKSTRAERLLSEGLTLLARADFFAAEKTLIKAAKISPKPLLAFLGAAKAARAQQAEERALVYMSEAQSRVGQDELALNLEKAKIEIESEQINQALNTLAECENLAPKNPVLTALVLQVALKTNDLPRLRDVLLNAASAYATPEDLHALEKSAILVLLTHFKEKQAFQEAYLFYTRLPRRLQFEGEVLCAYTDVLIATHEHARAKKLIERSLKRQWNGELVKRYAFVQVKNPITQLKQAETWLKQHPDDADLLLTLGRLCQQQQFWEQARALLQKSVQLKPQPEAYFELGQVCRACNEPAASVRYFEEGLKLSSGVV